MLLQADLIWKVGNGEMIRIWRDKWLPSQHSNMIQEPVSMLGSEARVSELIDYDLNWWDVAKVESIFPINVVESNCSIAICPRLQQDRLIWAGTKNGSISVRSAYHLELDRISWKQSSCSVNPDMNEMWNTI